MPTIKKNTSTLSAAQQEQLDRLNRQEQLANLYAKYPSGIAVPTPAPASAPIPAAPLNLLQKVMTVVSQLVPSQQTLALPSSGISDEEALKLNTEAGQLHYLQQEEKRRGAVKNGY